MINNHVMWLGWDQTPALCTLAAWTTRRRAASIWWERTALGARLRSLRIWGGTWKQIGHFDCLCFRNFRAAQSVTVEGPARDEVLIVPELAQILRLEEVFKGTVPDVAIQFDVRPEQLQLVPFENVP